MKHTDLQERQTLNKLHIIINCEECQRENYIEEEVNIDFGNGYLNEYRFIKAILRIHFFFTFKLDGFVSLLFV